ncbi:MAG TPA: hypothetical protein VK250_03410 [Nitrososphaeraceae archaeon]|nr:hypothetical protein [Nitrososphaeraceae archaeon]
MNRQRNKTISFVAIMIAAASITGLVTPSLGIDVQAEKDGGEYGSNYNDNKYKQESNHNSNYAGDEYAKYYDPKDKNVKVQVIKCENTINNIQVSDIKGEIDQDATNANIPILGGLGAEDTSAEGIPNEASNLEENGLNFDKNVVVICKNDNNSDNDQSLDVGLAQAASNEANQDNDVVDIDGEEEE